MSLFSTIACWLNQHDPMRRDVSWNGRAYVGDCRHCGAPIQRHGRRLWRRRKASSDKQPDLPTPI